MLPVSRLSITEIEELYSVPGDIVEKAFESFDSAESLALGFSGKMGAGKDTVAPLLLRELNGLSGELRGDSFGADLKAEMTSILGAMRASASRAEAVSYISEAFGAPAEQVAVVVDFAYQEAKEGVLVDGHSRSALGRRAIQFWATEIRRTQDPNYWVKSVVHRILEAASRGVSTQITDIRFPNEALGLLHVGGPVVRLDVSPEEQARRIRARDGVEISEEARSHESETALDGFEGFTVRLQTESYSSPEAIAAHGAQLISAHQSRLF